MILAGIHSLNGIHIFLLWQRKSDCDAEICICMQMRPNLKIDRQGWAKNKKCCQIFENEHTGCFFATWHLSLCLNLYAQKTSLHFKLVPHHQMRGQTANISVRDRLTLGKIQFESRDWHPTHFRKEPERTRKTPSFNAQATNLRESVVQQLLVIVCQDVVVLT